MARTDDETRVQTRVAEQEESVEGFDEWRVRELQEHVASKEEVCDDVAHRNSQFC